MSINFRQPDITPPIIVNARGTEALNRLRAEIMAVADEQLSPMNADFGVAVQRALGLAPKLPALRPIIERECPNADMHAIDSLEDRALAFATAEANWQTAIAPPQGIEQLAKDTFEARTCLAAVIEMFVTLNYIKREQTATLNGGRGQLDGARDVLAQVGVIVRDWDRLGPKCPLTRAELDQAQGTAEELIRRLGIKELSRERASDIADVRARAFTLLDQSYSQVRRVLSYIRWEEGDVDEIAPPLRSHPAPRKSADEEKPADTAKTEPGKTAEPTMVTGVPTTPAPSGLPRSNPFTVE